MFEADKSFSKAEEPKSGIQGLMRPTLILAERKKQPD